MAEGKESVRRKQTAQDAVQRSAGRRPRATARKTPALEWHSYLSHFLSRPASEQILEIRKGVPASKLVGAAEALRVPRERFFVLVGMSPSTAKRKLVKDEALDPLVSERLTRIGVIERLAEEVFGDAELANDWLQTRNAGLGDVSPLSMLDTEIGRDEVSRVLNAIAYGGVA